jgi:hypothetical protein
MKLLRNKFLKKQEVLGRTNLLIFCAAIQQFFYCYMCIRCRLNGFTELLPSTESGINI